MNTFDDGTERLPVGSNESSRSGIISVNLSAVGNTRSIKLIREDGKIISASIEIPKQWASIEIPKQGDDS